MHGRVYRDVIWGDISRYVNGENVLGGVAYKSPKLLYVAKKGKYMQCWPPINCYCQHGDLYTHCYYCSGNWDD